MLLSVEVWQQLDEVELFCSFATYNEKTILIHYKDRHGHGRQGLSCIYPSCQTMLQSHVDFTKHIKEHKKGSNPKLCCELCTFSAPTNIKQYCIHLKTHLRTRETVTCPFEGCSFKSSIVSTFTAHKSRYHQYADFANFKPDLVVKCHSQAFVNNDEGELNNSVSSELSESEFQPVHNSIERRVASLLLRLQAVLHVSQYAIQEIVDDLFDIGECAGQIIRQTVYFKGA